MGNNSGVPFANTGFVFNLPGPGVSNSYICNVNGSMYKITVTGSAASGYYYNTTLSYAKASGPVDTSGIPPAAQDIIATSNYPIGYFGTPAYSLGGATL